MELESVTVQTNPNRTSYILNETIDTTGLTVVATYNNGRTEIISNRYNYSPTKTRVAGNQAVTVSYGGKSTRFNVTVEDVVASGTCGENATWKLDGQGSLMLSGSGSIESCDSTKEESIFADMNVKNVVIENGITGIGTHTFDECDHIQNVKIPNSVISIGEGAFVDCINLQRVEIPNSVESIGDWCFRGCNSL